MWLDLLCFFLDFICFLIYAVLGATTPEHRVMYFIVSGVWLVASILWFGSALGKAKHG